MTAPRVPAPRIEPGQKLAGPVSYFPSIEKKYGEPMQHWLDIAAERLDAGDKHMEAVAFLKEHHGMGHGHAQSVVHYVKQRLDKE